MVHISIFIIKQIVLRICPDQSCCPSDIDHDVPGKKKATGISSYLTPKQLVVS